jgi:hypothetical protein
MESYNYIQVLANIYLSNNPKINKDLIQMKLITAVIFINYNDKSDPIDGHINIINISISENIDFNITNDLIINTLKANNGILIISKDNLIGFAIISAFIINYLNLNYLEILALGKILKIDISNSNYLNILYSYYLSKTNLI